MIVCFSCTPETKALLDGLVATGQYPDHSAVLAAAISNLSVIHSEMKGGAALVFGSLATAMEELPHNARTTERMPSADVSESRRPIANALLQHRANLQRPASLSQVTTEIRSARKWLPLNEWFFGQFNRLLPVKVTCRVLVNMTADGRDQFPLEETAIEIANEAAQVGRYLVALDDKRNLSRDDALAVAFPDAGQIKSIQRFANQFVGSRNKEGQLLGLPASLKLVTSDTANPDRIRLTDAGWTFGQLSNPLLDRATERSAEKFTDEEVVFLVDHIRNNVPVEAIAYKIVLSQVVRGATTPDGLDTALEALLDQSKEFGRPFVSTQRSGVISRMADLGLIARSRAATRVTYVLLPRGEEFLASLGGAS